MKTFEGKLVSKSIKVGIVAARFNEFITSKLLSGALDGLLRHEVREDDVHVAWVPGAFEIPLVASKIYRPKSNSSRMRFAASSHESRAALLRCAVVPRAIRIPSASYQSEIFSPSK